MPAFPKGPKAIRARIRSYERALKKEKELHGFYDDSHGKRYLLGPLYLLLGDVKGALAHFAWFKEMFPDDMGEPAHHLCWSLALYRSGDEKAAAGKLLRAMLSNLYLIPHLLGEPQEEYDICHPSNWEMKEYADCIPHEIMSLWSEQEKAWVMRIFDSQNAGNIRVRYIEIHRQLKTEKPGPKRRQLVEESFNLRNAEDVG
jgi:tetratricopeptide (TPR) repeat protein